MPETLSDLEVKIRADIKDLEKQLSTAKKKLEGLRDGSNVAAQGLQGMQSSSRTANNAMLNFNRVVSDAPFGLMAISNNIEPLFYSFQQLKAETGGTAGALKVFARGMIGPAGIVAAVSAAVVVIPRLIKKFKDAKKEATNAAHAISKEFASAIGALVGKDDDISRFFAETFSRTQLVGIRDNIDRLYASLADFGDPRLLALLNSLRESINKTLDPADLARMLVMYKEAGGAVGTYAEQLFNLIRRIRQWKKEEGEAAKRAREQAKAFEELKSNILSYHKMQLARADDLSSAFKGEIMDEDLDLSGMTRLETDADKIKRALEPLTSDVEKLIWRASVLSDTFGNLAYTILDFGRSWTNAGELFRGVGDIILDTLKSIVADLIAVTAKAVILNSVLQRLNQQVYQRQRAGSAFGSFLGSFTRSFIGTPTGELTAPAGTPVSDAPVIASIQGSTAGQGAFAPLAIAAKWDGRDILLGLERVKAEQQRLGVKMV